jgi:hypothetical protein
VGDIVIFVLKEAIRKRNNDWRYGKISAVDVDGRSSKVEITYRNNNESVFRKTVRHISQIVILLNMQDVQLNSYKHLDQIIAYLNH